MATKVSAASWSFTAKFRRAGFGWRGSKLAISRIDEALAEIRAVARHDPAHAAAGAVLLLTRLSPALSEVDGSSGALGNAAYGAVQTLAPIIASAPVSAATRSKWLEQLYEALEDDDPPYIESLGSAWGDLCATEDLASLWADRLLPTVRNVQRERKAGVFAWFKGTAACHSALFKAGRHEELLEVLASDPRPMWSDVQWGGRVLLARGAIDEAIDCVRRRAGNNAPLGAIARFIEEALLQGNRRVKAYEGYAIEANQANTRLATYRAIAKKYPEVDPDRLLRDLVESTPGEEGKWFATAKSLGRFEVAIELAHASPCDPKTLTRAARDNLERHTGFALQAALASLRWMAAGHGYEVTPADASDAWRLAKSAAQRLGREQEVTQWVEELLAPGHPSAIWMRERLGFDDARSPR